VLLIEFDGFSNDIFVTSSRSETVGKFMWVRQTLLKETMSVWPCCH